MNIDENECPICGLEYKTEGERTTPFTMDAKGATCIYTKESDTVGVYFH